MQPQATLHFFCGKAGAGKSTRARALARQHSGILLSEDVWLARLYGEQIKVFDDYIRYSQKLKTVIEPLVIDLLAAGQTVVMDFQANTKRRRQWFRSMFEAAQAAHVLHVLEAPDPLCLARIAKRNAELPEGSSHLTEADFRHVSSFFEPPEASEGFRMETWAS
jgi:predicted kinase